MGFHHRTCWHEGCSETVYGPGILCHEHRARQRPTPDHPLIEKIESERRQKQEG